MMDAILATIFDGERAIHWKHEYNKINYTVVLAIYINQA